MLLLRSAVNVPASVVNAVKEDIPPCDYCANKTLALNADGKIDIAAVTRKGMVEHAKNKDRDELTLAESTEYNATLAEVKDAPGILYLRHLPERLKLFHLVEIKNGKLFQQGKPFDTAGSIHVAEPGGPSDSCQKRFLSSIKMAISTYRK